MNIPAPLAPVKAAVLPLLKKDGLPEKARDVLNMLKLNHNVQYDAKDAIGRRYRRQDAIGTRRSASPSITTPSPTTRSPSETGTPWPKSA